MSPHKYCSTSNPFRATNLRPGIVPYHFIDGATPAGLVSRFFDLGGRAQIVGPHGSGKSTLLHALQAELSIRGQITRQIVLHDGQRRLPRGWNHDLPAGRPTTILVDGYEQLSLGARIGLALDCRRHRRNLLVTTHRSVWMPVLYETRMTPEIAMRVIDELRDKAPSVCQPHELPALLERHAGNLREALFELYDRYERRLESSPTVHLEP